MITPLIREYAAEKGMLFFRTEDDVRAYEKSVARYATDGDRTAVMRALMALGVDPAQIRSHLAKPGTRMLSIVHD